MYRGKPLDLYQKQLVIVEDHPDVYLTENDLNYMPTQEDLKTYNFYVEPELYGRFFHPYYCVRTVDKNGRVVGSELMLKIRKRG